MSDAVAWWLTGVLMGLGAAHIIWVVWIYGPYRTTTRQIINDLRRMAGLPAGTPRYCTRCSAKLWANERRGGHGICRRCLRETGITRIDESPRSR